jgi:Zn-dependent M28 family amino/carboxypeptidase
VKSWFTEDAARKLVTLSGNDFDELIESARSKDFKPVPLGVTTSLDFRNTIKKSTTANVYGRLRGSDPKVADEYVIYTAHHDHLGVGAPDATGDRIYNGALDNASGVAQLLAIGKAYKALPRSAQRRSVMLLFTAAEEEGQLGSQYYVRHSTVPAGRIAMDMNFDGCNIFGRAKDIVFVGKGKSSLDAVVDAVAKTQGRIVTAELSPEGGQFYRSDQFSFAKMGVPAVYLQVGTDFIGNAADRATQRQKEYEKHIHQPSDQIDDSWVFDGMVEDAQLGFLVGLVVANSEDLPHWVPGDEFEAARKAALAAAKRMLP